MDKIYNLNISGSEGSGDEATNTNVTITTKDLEQLKRILSLAGVLDTKMPVVVQKESEHVDDEDRPNPTGEMSPLSKTIIKDQDTSEGWMDDHGMYDDHNKHKDVFADFDEHGNLVISKKVDEDALDNDYGHRDYTGHQEEIRIKDINFRGRSDLPLRIVNRYGDNPIQSQMQESKTFDTMVSAYMTFLNENSE